MGNKARWGWIAALVLAGAGGSPAGAENPRISLKLKNVTPAEAVAQLSRAAGVRVDFPTSAAFGGAFPEPVERATYDWTHSTLARALRQICEKFNLRPARQAGGYVLFPTFNAAVPAQKRSGLVEKSGMRLFARSLTLEDRRTLNLAGDGPQEQGYGYLQLQIGVELAEGDGEGVQGLANVTAKDDTGNILTTDTSRTYHGYYYGQGLPDEWAGSIGLSLPDPKAKKLLWVEGDLMGYRVVKPARAEITLPVVGKTARKEVGDWLIVVSQYQSGTMKVEDDDEVGLPRLGFQPQNAGPSMRIRVYTPTGTRMASRSGWGMTPVLVDVGGKTYSPVRNSGSGYGDGQMSMNDLTLTYPLTAEPPAKLVWDLVERAEPVKLCSFRMTDVPLPQAQNFVARKTLPRPAAAAEVNHPYYERGGGSLVTRVRIGDRAAGLGTLQVGLAPKTAAGWGPNRWAELPVDAEGIATLKEIKPGTYRLLRVYRPSDGAIAPEGKWLNGEAVVTVTAAEETSAAPLRWSTGPAPGKVPAGKR